MTRKIGRAMDVTALRKMTPDNSRVAAVDPVIGTIADAPQADFNAAMAREHALQDGMPTALKRERKTTLPATENMNTTPRLVVNNKPLELPSEGMNILETSLHAGTNEETGVRRYLVVSMGTKVAKLLHIPDLEHVEVEVRYINDRIANGKAHWFALPSNLGQRLIDKSVQWEMHGIRYSRALLNEALTNLGMPALPEPAAFKAIEGTVAHEKATRRAIAKGERGPGVIETIVKLLREGGGTIDELLQGLMTAFPDRGPTMRNTIKTQLNRLPKQGKLEIKRVGDRYMASDVDPNARVAAELTTVINAKSPPATLTIQGAASKADALAKGTMPAQNDFQQEVIKQKAREEHYSKCPTGKHAKAKPTNKSRKVAKGKAKSKKKGVK